MLPQRILLKTVQKLNLKTTSQRAKSNVTALHDFHVENGGKLVDFGGFLLPVHYTDLSIVNSHLHTRTNASLFDVSHMLQTDIKGKDCIKYFESICTADVRNLKKQGATLTVFTDVNGCILDDLIVTKITEEHLYVVSNASRKNHDQKHMLETLEKFRKTHKGSSDIKINFHEPNERSLVALQGPKAVEALRKLTEIDLEHLFFMNSASGNVGTVKDCRITRCGYTGEDGFEISAPSAGVVNIVKELLLDENVKLAGLGARDSLRLEAGLCLYGSDISDATTPVEAALTWLIAKRRRLERNFPGAEKILKQIEEGSKVKRIGLISESGPPARHGTKIVTEDGHELGAVTSGCPSPSLGKNVAMGYVPTEFSKVGGKLCFNIRGKLYPALVVKMPFVKSNYYNKPK